MYENRVLLHCYTLWTMSLIMQTSHSIVTFVMHMCIRRNHRNNIKVAIFLLSVYLKLWLQDHHLATENSTNNLKLLMTSS